MSRRVYLDASALVKVILNEPESAPLAEYLSDWPVLVTSCISVVEVPRAVRWAGASSGSQAAARELVADCDQIELDSELRRVAAIVKPEFLKSLDAIHLASALTVQHLIDAFVTYDRRLAGAARDAGLPVVAPGQT